ncbi:hypothetical protein [Aestuariivirga sp.]|uniref:hypothetical protein n=1 Tax=Aestuariivirga sp. TaxID=2650926 RepID=UPI003594043D
MTLGLHQWLHLLACAFARRGRSRLPASLDLSRLSARDLRDLNLPPDMLCHMASREADALRRKVFR